MSPLQRIKQAIRAEHYRISMHANDEMAEDALPHISENEIAYAMNL